MTVPYIFANDTQSIALAELDANFNAVQEYTAPFFGGVNQTITEKLSQTLSIVDFGADPTGQTDSSSAIQNALNIINGGGCLFFPPGIYYYSTPLVLTVASGSPGIYLYGYDATLIYTGSTAEGYDAFTVQTANNSNASNLYVSGLQFKNGWSAFKVLGQGTGIFSTVKIVNCVFNTSASGMLWMTHCKDVIISNNHFYNGGDNGIYYNYSSDAVISNNVCINNKGSAGITVGYVDSVVTYAQNINIVGNTIYNDSSASSANYNSGITVAYANNVLVADNVIGNPVGVATGYGIKCGIIVEDDNIFDVSVKNNQIYNMLETGIRFGNDSSSTISNCNISNNQISNCQDAIDCYRTINSQIVGNVVNFTYKNGIYVDSTCTGINVANNILTDVNQQDPYGSYYGVFMLAPYSSVIGNQFIDSQVGGVITNPNGSAATYSIDDTSTIRLYSSGVLSYTINAAGLTWSALATAINSHPNWSFTLFPNMSILPNQSSIKVLRRTGVRANDDVTQYPQNTIITTPEPNEYIWVNSTATACTVLQNTYKSNAFGFTNHHNSTVLFNYQSDTLYDLTVYGGGRKLNGSAAPTSGYYFSGDVVMNSAPSAGGYVGWVCVTGGNPGTWKTFGAISS